MSEVTISIPEEAAAVMDMEPADLAAELRMAAAMKLFELERLSSGAAAILAGVPRTVFLSKLADYGIDTFRLTKAELKADAENARSDH